MEDENEFNGQGPAALEFAKEQWDNGGDPMDIAGAMITVGISMADAAHGKEEAILLLNDFLGDIRQEAH